MATKLHQIGDIVHVVQRRKRGHFCLPAIVVNSDTANENEIESLDLGVMAESYTYRADQYEGQWHDAKDCPDA